MYSAFFIFPIQCTSLYALTGPKPGTKILAFLAALYHNIYVEPKIRGLLFFCFVLPKHIKDMESKSISGVTSTCSNP